MLPGTRPIVIAHRGASALRPEHTLAAYALAKDERAYNTSAAACWWRERNEVAERGRALLAQRDAERDAARCAR